MYFRLSKAQQKLENKRHDLAREVSEAIQALPADAAFAGVPAIFAALPVDPHERYSVFQLLDEKPGLFHGYNTQSWSSRLRSCRNSPTLGKQLFAAFK